MTVSISTICSLDQEPVIAQPLSRELRRSDDFIRLAVVSVYEALVDRLPIEDQQATDWGLVVGTSFGPMETNFDVLDQVVNDEQTSPTLFSHSVFNGAAGYLTRIFNIRGNSLTLTDFFYPFFQALVQGHLAICAGKIDRCVVLQVETYSRLLHDARVNTNDEASSQWPKGSVAWLLERDSNEPDAPMIDSIKMEMTPNWNHQYLGNNDTLNCNGETIPLPHPLAAATHISKLLKKPDSSRHQSIKLSSTNGNIDLQIKR